MTQSNANKWIPVLLPELHQTLLDRGDVPARHLQTLNQRLAAVPAREGSASPLFFMTAPVLQDLPYVPLDVGLALRSWMVQNWATIRASYASVRSCRSRR
jgi:hypothetical protein